MPTRYFIISLIIGACVTWLAVSAQAGENSSNLLTASAAPDNQRYYVSSKDIAFAVSNALSERGAAQKVQATLLTSQPILQTATTPISVAIKTLDYNNDNKTWSAQMHILANNETLSVSPIQGRYEPVVSVPVLRHQMNHKDVISAADIAMKEVVERRLSKDAITSSEQLLGKSVIRAISPNRAVRVSEVRAPILVNKGQTIEIMYSTPYMTLRTMGQALEDGEQDALIRIKNNDSQRAISARVTAKDRVEANLQQIRVN